jgi:hypothetical protein
MSTASENITTVMNHALIMRKGLNGDGRLAALIDRSIKHITDAFPGQMKQVGKSKTVRAQMDKLIWEHAEPRIRRFLTNNKITLKLS